MKMTFRKYCSKSLFNSGCNTNGILQLISRNFSKHKSPINGVKVIKPENCRHILPPLAEPGCKVVVVVGGSHNGYGFSAAQQLLHHGAKRVILADSNSEAGALAAAWLCKIYGRERAEFYPCDVKNSCHVEGIFAAAQCRNEQVNIMFNDIDAILGLPDSTTNYCHEADKISSTQRLTRMGVALLAPRNSVIVNCATVLGFMGWPDGPVPVYCRNNAEPVLETTHDMAKKFTNTRLLTLCPINRTFHDIGLADLPEVRPEDNKCGNKICAPDPTKDKGRLGRALLHLLARAETGSAWIMEAPHSLHEIPRLVANRS